MTPDVTPVEATAFKRHEVRPAVRQHRANVWLGVVENATTSVVLWVCPHYHSKKQFNTRYATSQGPDPDAVWEYSAMNCARHAVETWPRPVSEGYVPDFSDIDNKNSSQMNVKVVEVNGELCRGVIEFTPEGVRRLHVHLTIQDVVGSLDLDDKSRSTNTSLWPSESRLVWGKAVDALLPYVHGTVFRDHDKNPVDPEKPVPKAYIRPVQTTTGRHFEVINAEGKVVGIYPHRGVAVRKMEALG